MVIILVFLQATSRSKDGEQQHSNVHMEFKFRERQMIDLIHPYPTIQHKIQSSFPPSLYYVLNSISKYVIVTI